MVIEDIGEQAAWTEIVAPFLRWPGAKTKLSSVLRRVLPPGRRLVEPFAGAGSVFAATRYPAYLLSDANPDLYFLWHRLRNDEARLLAECARLFASGPVDEDLFVARRERFNRLPVGTVERAALFVWLNRACFNGVVRYSRAGRFNVPFGRRVPRFPEAEMRAFARKLRCAELMCADFRDVFARLRPGDVVYCDPPYPDREAAPGFAQYVENGFTLDDHRDLAELARRAARLGIPVIVSNRLTERTRALFRGSATVALRLRHAIAASAAARRSDAEEGLFLFGVDSPSHIAVFREWTGPEEECPTSTI